MDEPVGFGWLDRGAKRSDLTEMKISIVCDDDIQAAKAILRSYFLPHETVLAWLEVGVVHQLLDQWAQSDHFETQWHATWGKPAEVGST